MQTPDYTIYAERIKTYYDVCDETECHLWKGGFGGYKRHTPVFNCPNFDGRHRTIPAYKAAWLLSGRTLKDGQLVYRKCMNYKCINPDHCGIGNQRKMWDHIVKSGKHKGKIERRLASKKDPSSKLTPIPLVRAAEELIDDGLTNRKISSVLGIDRKVVSDIRKGRHHHARSALSVLKGASVFAL